MGRFRDGKNRWGTQSTGSAGYGPRGPMTPGSGRFLRDNAFLVAAVSLPLVVIAFFLLAAAIPRWRVPPPAYDLLIRAADDYNPAANRRVVVDFEVRGGKVVATARPISETHYG